MSVTGCARAVGRTIRIRLICGIGQERRLPGRDAGANFPVRRRRGRDRPREGEP
jgi:hypothetical protein